MRAVVYQGPGKVSVEQAPEACERFDRREEGWSKVVLDTLA